MADFSDIVKQLITERDRLNAAIAVLQNMNGPSGTSRRGTSGKRRLSAASRAKMAAAQRRRWAKISAKRKTT